MWQHVSRDVSRLWNAHAGGQRRVDTTGRRLHDLWSAFYVCDLHVRSHDEPRWPADASRGPAIHRRNATAGASRRIFSPRCFFAPESERSESTSVIAE